MSADNWAICPSCLAKAEADKSALEAEVASAYGKVPVEAFDALRERANVPINREKLRTFREDYEFWIDGTTVRVSYKGGCHVCGSGLNFADGRRINIVAPIDAPEPVVWPK